MGKPLVADHLLFPDVLWHLPQNVHQRKGRILLIGGPQTSIHPIVEAAELCIALGVGEVTAALSETIAQEVQGLLPELTVVGLPETPTSSLAMSGSEQLLELAAATDVCLVGFSITKQAETQQLLKEITSKIEAAAIFFEDGLDTITGDDLMARKKTSLVLTDAGDLGRFLKRSGYEKAGDRPIVEHLYKDYLTVLPEIASSWRATLFLSSPEVTLAAPDGRVAVHSVPSEIIHRNTAVVTGLIAGLAAHQPEKLFECSATAIAIFAKMNERNLLQTPEKKRQAAPTIPAILLEIEKTSSA